MSKAKKSSHERTSLWPIEKQVRKAVSELRPFEKNSRTHSADQIDQICASITEWGWTMPILIDDTGLVLAGHARLLAAQKLGFSEVPCIIADGWSEAQKRAYVIADNRLSENAGWDESLLAAEFGDLKATGFDLTLTGFTLGEIGKLTFAAEEGQADDDAVPENPATPRSQPGDIWLLGPHRVMCGDSTDQEAVTALMAEGRADMVFTDPPYNVDYGANENPRHKIRKIKNDAMSEADWDVFVRAYVATLFAFCDGNIYIAMSDKELGHLQRVFVEAGGKWASFIVWVKDQLVLSPKDYHSRHETILYGWRDGVKGRQRVEDRTQDDVWEIPRPKNSEEHPTMKPVALVERAILNSSREGQTVLDLFGGSGSTLIAAQKTGRIGRLMELDPVYCDVIVKRWQDFTGEKARHAVSGEAFDGNPT